MLKISQRINTALSILVPGAKLLVPANLPGFLLNKPHYVMSTTWWSLTVDHHLHIQTFEIFGTTSQLEAATCFEFMSCWWCWSCAYPVYPSSDIPLQSWPWASTLVLRPTRSWAIGLLQPTLHSGLVLTLGTRKIPWFITIYHPWNLPWQHPP